MKRANLEEAYKMLILRSYLQREFNIGRKINNEHVNLIQALHSHSLLLVYVNSIWLHELFPTNQHYWHFCE
jgi:hypothetical protein